MDSASLILQLYLDLLHTISDQTGVHYAGLATASRQNRVVLGSTLSKKLIAVDTAFCQIRHVTSASCKTLVAQVASTYGKAAFVGKTADHQNDGSGFSSSLTRPPLPMNIEDGGKKDPEDGQEEESGKEDVDEGNMGDVSSNDVGEQKMSLHTVAAELTEVRYISDDVPVTPKKNKKNDKACWSTRTTCPGTVEEKEIMVFVGEDDPTTLAEIPPFPTLHTLEERNGNVCSDGDNDTTFEPNAVTPCDMHHSTPASCFTSDACVHTVATKHVAWADVSSSGSEGQYFVSHGIQETQAMEDEEDRWSCAEDKWQKLNENESWSAGQTWQNWNGSGWQEWGKQSEWTSRNGWQHWPSQQRQIKQDTKFDFQLDLPRPPSTLFLHPKAVLDDVEEEGEEKEEEVEEENATNMEQLAEHGHSTPDVGSNFIG